MDLTYIMFTKHLEGLDVPGIIDALQSVGVQGADLCVRDGYPVNPGNIATALPEAAKRFADEGLSIPLVTAPGDFRAERTSYIQIATGNKHCITQRLGIEHREHLARIGELHGGRVIVGVAGHHMRPQPLRRDDEFAPQLARTEQQDFRGMAHVRVAPRPMTTPA